MMRSLFSGVAGLKTHQTKMDVIGNNISNVNTVAFKSSSTTFSDIMYQTTSQASGATATRGGVNAKQIGLGVTNGATKVSVTSAGAAQSTGDTLDIRLTDTNTTNFFVVNNGSENVFTRAGSFYIDGNGNLAMTTTGYLVMGWQVDAQNPGIINKNTVSPLRVMQADNLTSAPEATTEANFSGVIDKNDSQFNSTGGYVRSFTFYDNLGYAYTAKFSIKLLNGDTNDYSIELTNILDADNNDLLARYTAMAPNNAISDIFPADDTKNGASTSFGLDSSKFSMQTVGTETRLVYTKDGTRYAVSSNTNDGYAFQEIDEATGVAAGDTIELTYGEIYGISSNILETATSVNEATSLLG
ncbi:MAG: flagellar hook-basal body complex protein, partial [Pseudobutyrivibrio sp.]|nr:flagellar hook-basal body complex protein [Pseudobutyrivibrio sp.]